MKTLIKPTSLDAYYSLIHSGELAEKQSFVLHGFTLHGPMTNLEASRILELPINQICPRVKELRDMELLEECGTKKDPITNKAGTVWRVKIHQREGELF